MLAINPEAQQLHQAGLEAGRTGDFAEAHMQFHAAWCVLANNLERTLDGTVQQARIIRDDGFTDVRAALIRSDTAVLDQARATVLRSAGMTEPLISGTAYLGIELPQPHETPKQARREVQAEHGATLGLLGRIATVKEVILGIDTRGNSEAARHARNEEQQPYGLAHDTLRKGNNGYYRVSNAMTGARQERLNGRLVHMGVWLGRAATGLAWTALRDPGNLRAAVRTAGKRVRHLRSYQAAIDSVRTNP